MFKRLHIRSSALLICLFTLFSCKKDKEQTAKDRIVGKWQLTAMTETPAQSDLDGDGTKDSDFYQFFSDCEKQYIYEFQADGTYIEDRTSCSPGSDDQTKSTWMMNTELTVVTVSGQVFNIDEIGDNTMSLSINTDLNGQNVKQTSVYTRQ